MKNLLEKESHYPALAVLLYPPMMSRLFLAKPTLGVGTYILYYTKVKMVFYVQYIYTNVTYAKNTNKI
jgi:hypothetical protein